MRKNFTQKFLTIFVFLTVYAFGFKAYAQPAPADCSIDNGGTIAIGSGAGLDTICRGENAVLIRGNGGLGSDSGTGTGGGPLVTFQWQYRNASTGGVFRNVDASVIDPDPTNCANPRNCNGTGASFNPGFLFETTDFVRIRYSGSAIVPQNCFKVSNVVTIYARDFYPPTIQTCVSSFTVNNNAGACTASVNLPGPGNFGPLADRNPNGVFATDNCTDGSRPTNTLRLTYRLASNGQQIANNANRNYAFPVGSTDVYAIVTDSTGNFEECPFTVFVNDTSKPVYGGARLLTRFTEPTSCNANITGSESSPMYSDCSSLTISYTIFDSIASNGRALTTTNNVNPGPYSGTTTNNIGDRTFRRGTYYIAYQATDSYGNVSGIPGQKDTLIIRVIDNVRPVVTAPRNDTFAITSGCVLNTGSITNSGNTFTGPGSSDCLGQSGADQTNLCTNARSTDNCQIMREEVYGPNDFTKLFNTSGVGWNNTFFNIGRNRLAYIVTDSSGNKSDTAYQDVYVRDASRPNVFCQANETLTTSNDARVTRQTPTGCNYRVSGLTNTFNDNCNVKFIRYTFTKVGSTAPYFDTTVRNTGSGASGSYTVNGPFQIGQTVVKSVAFDTTGLATTGQGQGGTNAAPYTANNGSDTCSFVVTLNDNTAPERTVACPTINLQLNNAGSGSITTAQAGSGNFSDCTALTFVLSKSTFNCTNMGANTVTLTATDAYGNSSTCQVTVNVTSSIVVTAVSNSFVNCNDGTNGSITTTATGGAGSYSYDIVAGPSDNNSGATSGTFTGLMPGNYTVRVTDANGCYSNGTVTIASPGKATTDVAVTASAADNFFGSVGETKQVLVTVRELGGFASDSAVVRIAKAQASGYTFSLGTGFDNANWTRREDASFVYFDRTGGLACGGNATLAINMTRNNPAQQQFNVTFRLIGPSEQSADYRYNDSFSVLFVSQ